MPGWLFLSASYEPRPAHYAGGDHAFACMAATLGALRHEVHLLYTTTRGAALAAAAEGGYLDRVSYSPHTEGVVTWASGGLTAHAALADADVSAAGLLGGLLSGLGGGGGGGGFGGYGAAAPGYGQASTSGGGYGAASTSSAAPAFGGGGGGGGGGGSHGGGGGYPGELLQRLLQEGAAVLQRRAAAPGGSGGGGGADFWVVVDADGAQSPPRAAGATASLLEAAVARWGRRVLVFAQNSHFLPFGPGGTAPRSPGLLRAWQLAGGALAPSRFVAGRLFDGGGGPLPATRVCVVSHAAWGAFGKPPFEDVGGRVTAALQEREARVQQQAAPPERGQGYGEAAPAGAGEGQGGGADAGLPPVMMLKLTREKGSDVFFALARALPSLRFVAVTADPQLSAQAAALGPPNVALLPPQPDVGALLAGASAVVVPSVWEEAFGMVAVDAALRGLPVLASDRGGLPEAGLGAATLLPVEPMLLPCGGDVAPSWGAREFPEQPAGVVAAWAGALSALLLESGAAERYAAQSVAARAAAGALVEGRNAHLAAFRGWLEALEAMG
ncbi:hypothetical protein Rsub_10286 [Raphidocelis subcapitata]|uniref:Glycosyl transferase family 1 domain-containing protein n=1 Tax=Raphidocelis subcapitata TaxID=307507 RepID=A0A2V0PDX7_9CHLO|nr:hypothetical protein Rsub_10286 [Raphidocelis subcapitata]|eukprot:GBF98058.1 hypothetical protein Rsub_10286 [Raphidocelis subcapitata]